MAKLLVLAGFILLGLVLFQLGSIVVLSNLFGYDFPSNELGDLQVVLQSFINNPEQYPHSVVFIMLLQGATAIGAFLLIPFIYLQLLDYQLFKLIKLKTPSSYIPLLLTVVAVIASMPFNSLVNYWNIHIDLPAYFDGFEQWAASEELNRKELVEFLTSFTSAFEIFLGFLVIAVIPAITEEFLFRGIIQKTLHVQTGRIHLSIWVSAIIFSAIHIQFFGFFPRLFLGALFGYLYAWSNNLWMPILAHFINNGVTLLAIVLYRGGSLDLDVQEQTRPSYMFSILSLLITLALLYSFKKYFDSKKYQDTTSES